MPAANRISNEARAARINEPHVFLLPFFCANGMRNEKQAMKNAEYQKQCSRQALLL
jgi:hypothetical protein